MNGEPITLTNTALPFAVLAVFGLVIPRLLLPQDTRSYKTLWVVMGVSAIALLILGLVGAAVVKMFSGADVTGAFARSPSGTLVSLAKTSALGILVWAPFVAFSGLSLGKRIEGLREKDMRRQDA